MQVRSNVYRRFARIVEAVPFSKSVLALKQGGIGARAREKIERDSIRELSSQRNPERNPAVNT